MERQTKCERYYEGEIGRGQGAVGRFLFRAFGLRVSRSRSTSLCSGVGEKELAEIMNEETSSEP
jgi:hypothetical protein